MPVDRCQVDRLTTVGPDLPAHADLATERCTADVDTDDLAALTIGAKDAPVAHHRATRELDLPAANRRCHEEVAVDGRER